MDLPMGIYICSYDFDSESIRIGFSNNEILEFTVREVGYIVVEQLRRRAVAGVGLEHYLRSLKIPSSAKIGRWRIQ